TIQELDTALPFQAAAARESRLGTHFGAFDVVIMVADASAIDTARHEMTHAIIEDAVNLSTNPFTNFPVWLNEGLATYFQLSQGSEWAPFLQAAIRANRVLQLKDMVTYPGREEEKLLVYAQGVSVVRFLLERYGPERMAQLLAVYREGSTDDAAFQRVYGKNLLAIENEWRQSLNIPLAQPPATGGQTGNAPRPIATLPPLDVSGGTGGAGSTPPSNAPQPQPGGGSSGAPSPQPAQDTGRLAQALPILALVGGGVVVLLVVVVGAVVINARRHQV
ncbi:MAG: peptidase MA family metallohydrolase, partial [Dehalococcoidia bacterium]|nr:peptidase MA family metallohydrolase [Dehalococcoidia bacterium]